MTAVRKLTLREWVHSCPVFVLVSMVLVVRLDQWVGSIITRVELTAECQSANAPPAAVPARCPIYRRVRSPCGRALRPKRTGSCGHGLCWHWSTANSSAGCWSGRYYFYYFIRYHYHPYI